MRAIPQLKRIREERALSQRDLAAMSGVAHDSIGQIERGVRKARPSTIRKLAEALSVEPSVLLEEQPAASERQISLEGDKPSAERGREDEPPPGWHSFLEQALEEESRWLSSIHDYEEEIAVARSKILIGETQENLEIAQFARRKADEIWNKLVQHVHANSEFLAQWRHILGQEPLGHRAWTEELRTRAAEAIQAWLSFYSECLDTVDEDLVRLREEGTTLQALVRRVDENRAPDLGERAPEQKSSPIWRDN